MKEYKDHPLSSPQMGIYLSCIERAGEAAYNNPLLLRFAKSIDFEKLRAAFEKVLEAHPNLNTRIFTDAEGNPRQKLSEEKFILPKIEKVTDAELEEIKKTFTKPFDLLHDALFRIRFFETESGNFILLDAHHIIFDGSSFMVMMHDAEEAYNGKEILPEDYDSFCAADDEPKSKSPEYEEAKKWHLEKFGGIEGEWLLTADKDEKEITYGRAEADYDIDIKKVEALCLEANITKNVLVTAAFAHTLSLFANTNDALFATIYSGRSSPKTARTVGMFVQTLPFYISCSKDQTVKDYLLSAKENIQATRKNSAFPFLDLAAQTGITSDVLFAYQSNAFTITSFAGVEAEQKFLTENATGEKLAVQVYKTPRGFKAKAEYQSNLYSDDFIKIFLDSYGEVLKGFLEKTLIKEISATSDDQRSLLQKWNSTECDYDESQTVVSLFEEAAKKYPSNTAVIFGEKKFTYAEVEEKAVNIASYIHSKGLGRGDVVSILIGRGEYQVIASLGALRARCAYQPLDPTYPEERLNFMVKDSGARLLITSEELQGKITDFSGGRLLLSQIESLPKGELSGIEKNQPDDNFILLYTSGSTGVPKGVRLLHKNLVCFIAWYKRFYKLTEHDVVGQYASYGFDACMMDMYPALSTGAAVCIIPEELRLDLNGMDDYMTKSGVSLIFMTTQVGRQYATEAKNPHLRALSTGGEKLASMQAPSGFDFYNVYGPTECTIFSTTYKVGQAEKNIPIGKPLENLKCYVVDANKNLLPPGAVGELYIAGPQVSAGYLNRPEKTAEVFIKNPFDGGAYSACYRTGDIVRFRCDGNIEFIGRRDGQVKIRGFRIELTEVEAVIREFDGIKDATVQAFDHPAGGKFIAAYVVSEKEIDKKSLENFILERKPPYMVPAAIVQLEKIPLNQNSKVNKKALPVPDLAGSQKSESQTREFNLLEKELLKIAEDAIGSNGSDFSTPLQYLGLSSITAIRLSSHLYKRFNVSLQSKRLLGQTLLEVENEILKAMMEGENNLAASSVQASSSAQPLSASQLGIYLDCMKDQHAVTYNIPSVLEFSSETKADELVEAVKKIVTSHPSVFVHFEMQGDGVVAVSEKEESRDFEIPVYKMTEDECKKFSEHFVQPFHLDSFPLFRFAVVCTKESVALFADFHHLIFDGMSLGVFLSNLKSLLENKQIESEAFSYSSFVQNQEKAKTDGTFDAHQNYFKDLFKNFEAATELSPDLPPKEKIGNKGLVEKEISEDTISAICKRTGATEAGVFLSALDYALFRHTASNEVYISTISSGRSDVRYSDTFGMFVNTLPLFARLEDKSVDDYIRGVAKGFDRALEHEAFPFAKVSADYSFKPKIMYEFQRGVVEATDIPGLKKMTGLELDKPKFPLIVRINDGEKGPAVSVEYDDLVYTKTTVQRLVQSICIVLDQFAHDGNRFVKKVSLLDETREKEIALFRGEVFVGDERLPAKNNAALFQSGLEHYAEKNPDKTALIACDASYSYKEFDRAANRIANSLIALGVQKGSRVAILLPRTSKVLLSIFGVLKAGAAYIPCDPEYPVERIEHILNDSGAAKIITTADRLSQFENGRAIDVESLLNGDDSKPSVEISPDDLAYLIYTSGSTGKPKGVMLRHRGAANYMTNDPKNIMVDAIAKEALVYVSITTLSFDMSIKEFGIALSNGKTVVLADDHETKDADALASLMQKNNADILNATPSRLLSLMESEAFCASLSKCKVIICGAEKYAEGLLPKLRALSKARIFNSYGPTEITVSSNAAELTKAKSISVGRPLLNVREYIVDLDGNELPLGITGELYIGGLGVAAGYNNLPEETAKRFIEYKGGRVYKSGDWARWTADGYVEILGRRDNQIKLRGLRIEIGEVEAAISSYEGISRVAVKIEKISGIEHLCAWFTAVHQIDIGELKAFISKTLTNYMVPTAYMQLEKMPVTPNGKLELKNLPVPEIYRAKSGAVASNEIEKAFCEIFSKVLHIEDVSPDEDFFALGGTSLLVTSVVIAAGRAGYKITFGDVFSHPTAQSICAFINGGEETQEQECDKEIEDYDYSGLKKILSQNNLENFKGGAMNKIGNVLLTGATGYLGIHILKELIEREEGKIFCLVRSDPKSFMNKLFYYFENDYSELFGKRIFMIRGDVLDTSWFSEIQTGQIDTVINCAAVVKHFSKGTEIEDVNVGGVKNLIDLCLEKNIRLIQISTMSTVDSILKRNLQEGFRADERTLYFRQNLSNQYVRSKFLGEREVLEAVAQKGLKAKIMRVGNLSARFSDGEFQINFMTNSAMGRLKAYAMLGACPYSMLDKTMEFSPIDEVAHAIVLLSKTPDKTVLFHPYNHQRLLFCNIFEEMQKLGLSIKPVESDEFQKINDAAKGDPKKAEILTSIIAYAGKDDELAFLDRHNDFTMQALYRMGYKWLVMSNDYVRRFITGLKGLCFFDV